MKILSEAVHDYLARKYILLIHNTGTVLSFNNGNTTQELELCSGFAVAKDLIKIVRKPRRVTLPSCVTLEVYDAFTAWEL